MDYLKRIVGYNQIEDFSGLKLPSVIEVISVFLYHKQDLKLQQKESLSITIDKLKKKWSQAGIPTCGKEYAAKKLTNLLNKAKRLQKSTKRKRSKTQKLNESNFSNQLKNVFDIAKFNVEKYINNDRKLFLEGQRSRSRYGLIDCTSKSKDSDEETMVLDSADGKFTIFLNHHYSN